MYGMHFVPLSGAAQHHAEGLAASQQILSVVVAVLCFVIAAGFLLSLVPDPRRQAMPAAAAAIDPVAEAADAAQASFPPTSPAAPTFPRLTSAPLGALGPPPRAPPAPRLPRLVAHGTPFT